MCKKYNEKWTKAIDHTLVSSMGLGIRIENIFKENNIVSLADIRNGFPDSVLDLKGFGYKCFRQLRDHIGCLDSDYLHKQRSTKWRKWFRINGIKGYFISEDKKVWSATAQRCMMQYPSKNGLYVMLTVHPPSKRKRFYIDELFKKRIIEEGECDDNPSETC